jgi:hypothetical protein
MNNSPSTLCFEVMSDNLGIGREDITFEREVFDYKIAKGKMAMKHRIQALVRKLAGLGPAFIS